MHSKVLDSDTVRKIAFLARLCSNPSPEFLEKYGLELGAVLEYMEELKEVDTSKVSVFSGSRIISISDLREDLPHSDTETYARIRQNIIQNFPNRQGDLLVLPGIFESD
jgi:aspartyl/glutamyl-tRNA(Asn/Gln) amidotransferase C subunit